MINVIATIALKPGLRDDFLRILKDNVPRVLAEDGCISYTPCLDVDSGLPLQGGANPNVVTIIEAWESLDHLNAHLRAPHMKEYSDRTKDMKVGTTLRVVKPA